MYIIAKFQHLTPVPEGAVYMGDGVYDVQISKKPENIKELMAEYSDDLKQVYKKPGFNKEVLAEKEKKKKK